MWEGSRGCCDVGVMDPLWHGSALQNTTPDRPLPLALRPLSPVTPTSTPLRHKLSPFNVACPHCQPRHWIEERISASSVPQFSKCCENGAVELLPFPDPPEPLYSYYH